MRFLSYILRDWPLKLLALVMASFLWAAYTAEPLAEAGYNVPVIFRNLPQGLDLAGEEITQVHVVMRGRAEVLRRLEPRDLALQVDLAGRVETDFSVALEKSQVEVPAGTELVSFSPAELRVRLVPRQP